MKISYFLLTFVFVFCIVRPAEAQKKKKKEIPPEVYTIVEEMPRFSGCEGHAMTELQECAEKKMLEFIYSNLEYPQSALDNEIEGLVVVNFIVAADGTIKNAKIIRGIYPACDSAALNIVNSFPAWIPGKEKGKQVPVYFNLPVRFKFQPSTVHREITPELLNKITPNYEGLQFLFCADYTGEIIPAGLINETADDNLNTKNLCGFFHELTYVKITYEESGKTTETISDIGELTDEIRAVFRNAKVGGAININFIVQRDGRSKELTKIIILK